MKLYGFASAGIKAPEHDSVVVGRAHALDHDVEREAGAGRALRREDDLLKRRNDVVGGQRRAVGKLHALPDIESIGLAAVGRLRHFRAQIANEIRRRGRIIRIDLDEQAVERRERMDQRERRLPVPIPARRLVRHDEIQDASLLGGLDGQRCAGKGQGKPCRQRERDFQS
jgi:hypothetical protein